MKILSVLLVGLAALASPFAVAGRVHHKQHAADMIDSSNIAQAFAEMVRTAAHAAMQIQEKQGIRRQHERAEEKRREATTVPDVRASLQTD